MESLVLLLLLVIAFGVAAILGLLFLRSRASAKELSTALQRYSSIIDIESHVAAARAEAQRITTESQAHVAGADQRATELHGHATQLEQHIQQRQSDLAVIDEQLELQAYGVYEPRFEYDDPEHYQLEIKSVRSEQKSMIKAKVAAEGGEQWTVDGSQAKGRQMVDRQKKLMLRAFNGECDASIAKVKHSNAEAMINRIEASAKAVNKLGDRLGVWITGAYVQLKLKELYLVHERHERLQEIKEEQREIREQMREEQKAEKERQKAIREAEKEAERQEAALEKARAELAHASAQQRAAWEGKVADLEAALEATQRRKSQAELTRMGHVYIISNIGSFGEDIYKIGMTRRLEPLDRVRELGDASVPFKFDVHAMIVAHDAPALETALHKHFDARRMNKVNRRREFFRVTLDEVEQAVSKLTGANHELVRTHAAEDYRETMAMDSRARSAEAGVPPTSVRPPPPPPPRAN